MIHCPRPKGKDGYRVRVDVVGVEDDDRRFKCSERKRGKAFPGGVFLFLLTWMID